MGDVAITMVIMSSSARPPEPKQKPLPAAVRDSLDRAPFDDEPLSEEDRASIEEARAERRRGVQGVSTSELRRRLGL